MNTEETAVFEYINPETAIEYLTKNTSNRPIQQHHIRHLCEEMINGRWKFNGDTIVFDWNGVLRQGQHRLSALIKIGFTSKFLVVRGVDPTAFSTMDCGKQRSGSDALALIGETNTKTKASVLVWIDKYYSNGLNGSSAGKIKISPTWVLELNDKYSDYVGKWHHQKHLGCSSIINAAGYIFSKISNSEAEDFISKVLSGENLISSDPEYLLRNRLLNNLSSKAKLSNRYIFALFIKAWNARRAGVGLKNLRFREEGHNVEDFPRAI
jgi:hypothetical protein